MRKENNMYYAADSKLIVRKSDGKIMGDAICLSESDNIDNYEERDFTKEEITAFNESVDIRKTKPHSRKKN